MDTLLNLGRDIQGLNTFARPPSTVIFNATLTSAHGETHFTVPSDHAVWIAYITVQADTVVWVRINGTAAVPAGATWASANSELVPAGPSGYYALVLKAGDEVSMITSSTSAGASVALYPVSYP